ncbi:MAG: diphosphatase, partial [Pseudonocardiales bacterium]|nr:diphosphatase [Pseudonocardiales bacterium]
RALADGPILSRAAFDRMAARRTDEHWLADAWSRARVMAITPKSATATTADGRSIAWRAAADIPSDATRRFLGAADGELYFAATIERDSGSWATLRDLGRTLDDLPAGLFAAAIALEQWHQRHTHCPLCGTPTVESHAGWQRRCPADGSDHFPRTDPAVIMLIHDGGELALLGRGREWNAGRFSTLAGFVEPGESLEAAVAREVHEEVGVQVVDIRYVASQPWPFPASLMLGFSGRLAGDPGLHLDPVEMAEAGWFTRAEVARAAHWVDTDEPPDAGARLQGVSPKLSISRYLIDLWLAGQI